MIGVRADNEPALALYTRHGFEQIARRRGYCQGGTDGFVSVPAASHDSTSAGAPFADRLGAAPLVSTP